ncbi:TPA: membrane protein YoeI, partial [Escherichia coli]|nr:membrane protein YoeI [Escherichia coli]
AYATVITVKENDHVA